MRISDWSSDVVLFRSAEGRADARSFCDQSLVISCCKSMSVGVVSPRDASESPSYSMSFSLATLRTGLSDDHCQRSEEHTSELQSLMRISYAVFCFTKKIKSLQNH